MENKIEIHNMNLHYGDFHALEVINLDLKENAASLRCCVRSTA